MVEMFLLNKIEDFIKVNIKIRFATSQPAFLMTLFQMKT